MGKLGLRLSEKGKKIVEEEYYKRVKCPNNDKVHKDIFFNTSCHLSEATFNRFRRGIRIDKANFYYCCEEVLGLTVDDVVHKEKHTCKIFPNDLKSEKFVGREKSLSEIKSRIFEEKYRLGTILGIGGIGKTFLAKKLCFDTDIQLHFDYIYWLKVTDSDPDEALEKLTLFISENKDKNINKTIDYLQQAKVLIILDEFEHILKTKNVNIPFAEDKYRNYSFLIKEIVNSKNKSFILLTSQIKTDKLEQLEKRSKAFSIKLTGSKEASLTIINDLKLKGTKNHKDKLCKKYNNHPFAIKLISQIIKRENKSTIALFLETTEKEQLLISNELIIKIVGRIYEKVTDSLETILYWLTLNQIPMTLDELKEDIQLTQKEIKISSTLKFGVNDLSLIEVEETDDKIKYYYLHSIIREFLTKKFIESITNELLNPNNPIIKFINYPLIKLTSKDYVAQIQKDKILRPITDSLSHKYNSKKEFKKALKSILDSIRSISNKKKRNNYGAGNLINLFNLLKVNPSGLDFSNLKILHASLQNSHFKNVNFSNAQFKFCKFYEPMGSILTLESNSDGDLLAAGDVDGKIYIWELNSGPIVNMKKIGSFTEHSGRIRTIKFSYDSTFICSGSEDSTTAISHKQLDREKYKLKNSKILLVKTIIENFEQKTYKIIK